ncbi:hypothetical protein OUZ56_009595 [Daphnia magna]|uniref:Uncharacterized protein n=1 Tax=Daphnia magna TaxID=35525 RepID=A0ABR0AGW2_9CRUS|nr:hypothetical protein OUZ56_009595 [Daphnia magna]
MKLTFEKYESGLSTLPSLLEAVHQLNSYPKHPNRISGCPEDIKKMYSASDPDICRTSDGLHCVMWCDISWGERALFESDEQTGKT